MEHCVTTLKTAAREIYSLWVIHVAFTVFHARKISCKMNGNIVIAKSMVILLLSLSLKILVKPLLSPCSCTHVALSNQTAFPYRLCSFIEQFKSYLMYDVHAKMTAPKSLLDKFGKISSKHHFGMRLSAKECFSVKFSRTEKMKKVFY